MNIGCFLLAVPQTGYSGRLRQTCQGTKKEVSITTEVTQDLEGNDPFDIASYVSLANRGFPRPRGSVHSASSFGSSESANKKIAKVRVSALLSFSDDIPQCKSFADACNSATAFVLHLLESDHPESKELMARQVDLLQSQCQQYFFKKRDQRLQASLNCILVLGYDEQGKEVPEEIRELGVQYHMPLVLLQAHANMTEVFARIAALVPSWADRKEQEEAANNSASQGKKVERLSQGLVSRVTDMVGAKWNPSGAFFGRKKSVESVSSSGSAESSCQRGSYHGPSGVRTSIASKLALKM